MARLGASLIALFKVGLGALLVALLGGSFAEQNNSSAAKASKEPSKEPSGKYCSFDSKRIA